MERQKKAWELESGDLISFKLLESQLYVVVLVFFLLLLVLLFGFFHPVFLSSTGASFLKIVV